MCLSACLQSGWLAGWLAARRASVALALSSSRGVPQSRQDGSKAGRTQSLPAHYGRSQTGRRDTGSRGTTHAAFTPAHRAPRSPSSPPVCLFSPLPLSHRTGASNVLHALLCALGGGRTEGNVTIKSNQINPSPPLPRPKPIERRSRPLPAIWEGFTRLCLIFPSWLCSSYPCVS